MMCSVLGAVGYWYLRRSGPSPVVEQPGAVLAPAAVPIHTREAAYGSQPTANGYTAPAVVAAEATPVPVAMPDTTPRDNNGHDEAWWRARCDAREARLAVAQQTAADATQVADAAANAANTSRIAQAAGASQVAELQARATIAQRTVQAIEAEADALKEECRKANCYPGWLR